VRTWQGDAAVFEGETAAAAVVTGLDDLVLQRLIGEVVADASDEVKTLSRFAAVTSECTNLIRSGCWKAGNGDGGWTSLTEGLSSKRKWAMVAKNSL